MTYKTIVSLLCAFALLGKLPAQPQQPVSVGDQCPDLTIPHVINNREATIRISDFRGKLLILDFWATWCMPCLSMLPVTEKLQQEFADRIRILPVTDQPSGMVQAFLDKRYQGKGQPPATATDDVLLRQVFPHEVIPHYVWIGKDGRVIAITGYEAMTAANISTALATNRLDVALKDDRYKQINEANPMFYAANVLEQPAGGLVDTIRQENLLYHSVLTGFIPGFFCEAGTDSLRITIKNESVGDLYRVAAGRYDLQKLSMNSTIWEVRNPLALPFSDSAMTANGQPGKVMPWLEQHAFCYELKTPPALQEKQFDIMLADLNNYFGVALGIRGAVEKRKTTCLVLRFDGDADRLRTTGGKQALQYDANSISLHNQRVGTLINILSFYLDGYPPILDQSGFTGMLDLSIQATMTDLRSVNSALKNFGLTLTEEEAEMDMIVIRDR